MTDQTKQWPPLDLDADEDSADWPKRTWDVDLPRNIDEMREWLRVHGMTVEQFNSGPAVCPSESRPQLSGAPPHLRSNPLDEALQSREAVVPDLRVAEINADGGQFLFGRR